jgi:hypothetical protein
VPIGDRVEVNVGRSGHHHRRRLKDQQITNVVARQYKRRLDNTYVLYYDLIDYDETFVYETEIVSGKPVLARSMWSGVRRQRVSSGAATASRTTGTATNRAPTSTCTRSAAASSGSTRTT